MGVSCVFLDSGAFSLYAQIQKQLGRGIHRNVPFFGTSEFWEYVDAYAAFLKKYKNCFDLYANCDAISKPEKTWEVQQYLENEHGLLPVPVVHSGEPRRWVRHYLERGYEYLAFGGKRDNLHA